MKISMAELLELIEAQRDEDRAELRRKDVELEKLRGELAKERAKCKTGGPFRLTGIGASL